MADIVNIQLRTQPFSFSVRVTTLHMLIGGAIAAGVLYLVNELVRIEREATMEVDAGAAPAPFGRVTSAS